MSRLVRVGLIATLALATLHGCEEPESSAPTDGRGGHDQPPASPTVPGNQDGNLGQGPGGAPGEEPGDDEPAGGDSDELDDPDLDDPADLDEGDAEPGLDDELGEDDDELGDGDVLPPQGDTPRTAVPSELVGAWEHGYIDFELWENYRPEHWGGRNAIPSREAMVFYADGAAKFYRYEFALHLYEELIDCEGTVTFNNDGTFTFYPTKGRKRFLDNHHPSNSVDRPLTDAELQDPKIAGTRAYAYVDSSEPHAIQVTVPSSAPYKWYRKE